MKKIVTLLTAIILSSSCDGDNVRKERVLYAYKKNNKVILKYGDFIKKNDTIHGNENISELDSLQINPKTFGVLLMMQENEINRLTKNIGDYGFLLLGKNLDKEEWSIDNTTDKYQ